MQFTLEYGVFEDGRKAPEYSLETDLRGEISLADFLAFTKSSLIIIADQVLKEEQDNGFDKNPVLVVDGSQSKPIANVSPLGSIEFVSRANITDIIRETFDGLIFRSPIDTGKYVSSHVVLLNNSEVARGQNSLDSWLATNPQFKDSDTIKFVNLQPYARKLERLGVSGQRQQSRTVKSRDKRKAASGGRILAPNGAYFLTTRAIKAKYKQNINIKFSFIPGGQLGLKGSFKVGRNGKPGRSYLYPIIILTVNERGIA